MANTYSQIYIQIVFSVQNRETLLKLPWRLEVYKYISGIIKNKGIKPIIINGMEDHVHIIIELKPESSLSDLVRDIKKHSTILLINRIGFHINSRGKVVLAPFPILILKLIKYIIISKTKIKSI